MNFTSYLKDKKITVLRIGLLGRGVGDAAYMAELGASVLVVDDAPQAVMQPSVDALAEYKNVTFKFGPYDTADFTEADLVLVGAGTPLDSPELAAARAAGVPLKQSAALFAELSGIPVIGITGTRGKSTVTHMIHHVLSEVTGEEVLLGGNIRGVSNLQLLKNVKEESIAVMELDSWQLQGFGWAKLSPQISVFTNFMEDHLNYYQTEGLSKSEGMQRYFQDKAYIFTHQTEGSVLVTTPEVFDRAKTLAGVTLGQEVVLVDVSIIPEDVLLAMPGTHNRLNAALAYSALKVIDLSDEQIFDALATFPGVPGRLQGLGSIDGVKVFNDNNATTPQATAAGVRAVATGKNVVLIAGGSDKNIPVTELVEAITEEVKQLVLYSGTGTEKLKAALPKSVEYTEFELLNECVDAALAAAQPGDVVLFSPGFSSFGKYYKNEYDRNDQFVALINEHASS